MFFVVAVRRLFCKALCKLKSRNKFRVALFHNATD
jgi:hypothetical protein